MKRLFSKADLQAFSSILAFVLLLSSVPLTSGVVIVPSRGFEPVFTINICQPSQIFGYVSNTILARPSVNVPEFRLFFRSSLKMALSAEIVEYNAPPDTPPPKPLV